MWNQMGPEERAPYAERCQQLKAEYDRKKQELQDQGFQVVSSAKEARMAADMRSTTTLAAPDGYYRAPDNKLHRIGSYQVSLVNNGQGLNDPYQPPQPEPNQSGSLLNFWACLVFTFPCLYGGQSFLFKKK